MTVQALHGTTVNALHTTAAHHAFLMHTVNDIGHTVVDLAAVYQLQVRHGVLLKEAAASPLLPDVVSIIKVLMLNVGPVICVSIPKIQDVPQQSLHFRLTCVIWQLWLSGREGPVAEKYNSYKLK